MAKRIPKPTWNYERTAWESGRQFVAGIDEAGRGPLAGPVVAAAVIFPPGVRVNNLRDSKLLKPEVREKLAERIREKALACGVGIASAYEIDRFNILEATHIAARRAVEQLGVAPDYYLTDNLRPAWARAPVEALVNGDAKVASIAAASILAKTARDRMMVEYDGEYPGYGFAGHKGYCCKPHFAALDRLGPCTLHRLTFQGVAFFTVEPRPSETYRRLKEAIAILEGIEAAHAIQREIATVPLPLVEREREKLGNLLTARLGELGLRIETGERT